MLKGTEYDIFGYPIIKDFEIPLIPDFALNVMKENRRYREDTKEWSVIYEFPEVNVGRGIRAPNSYSDEDKSEYLRVYGEIFSEKFNREVGNLRGKKYNAIEVQKIINSLRRTVPKLAKKKFKRGLE